MFSEISAVRSRGCDRWEVELGLTVIRRRGAFILEGVKSVPAEPDPQ